MSKQKTATTDPAVRLVEVFKSLAADGQRTNPDIVRKSADEMTLSEFGVTMTSLLMREAQQQDPFLTKPQARAAVYRTPTGRVFASLDRLPHARQPVAKAVALIENMGRGGWAEDLLSHLTAIDRGWV